MTLRRTSIPLALGSAASLGAQVLFSVLLLRLFSPQAVGEFSVISQVAFFWMTLALAQSPLKLLADAHQPPVKALRDAMRGSLWRFGLLLPLAVLALLLSGIATVWQAMAWATLLGLLQIGMNLAQTFNLRVSSAWFTAAGRVLPSAAALLVAGLAGIFWSPTSATELLLAAALGYACGVLWLLPAFHSASGNAAPQASAEKSQSDDRSTALRLTHTAADALTGTAVLLLWQRSHGAIEAGYLAVLLRLLGFVPAVIHTAWAQVLLAQAPTRHTSPLLVGLAGSATTVLLGVACLVAIHLHWLAAEWGGLLPYVWPLVLWQACACMLAACSHLPFRNRQSTLFSRAAIGFDTMQLLVLCLPLVFGQPIAAVTHVWWLSALSCAGLLALVVWLIRGADRR